MATCCDLPDHVNGPASTANGSMERDAGVLSPAGRATAAERDHQAACLPRELGARALPADRTLSFSLRDAREIPDGAARTSDWLLCASDDEPGR